MYIRSNLYNNNKRTTYRLHIIMLYMTTPGGRLYAIRRTCTPTYRVHINGISNFLIRRVPCNRIPYNIIYYKCTEIGYIILTFPQNVPSMITLKPTTYSHCMNNHLVKTVTLIYRCSVCCVN